MPTLATKVGLSRIINPCPRVPSSPISPVTVSLTRLISSAEEPGVVSSLPSYRWGSGGSEGLGKAEPGFEP